MVYPLVDYLVAHRCSSSLNRREENPAMNMNPVRSRFAVHLVSQSSSCPKKLKTSKISSWSPDAKMPSRWSSSVIHRVRHARAIRNSKFDAAATYTHVRCCFSESRLGNLDSLLLSLSRFSHRHREGEGWKTQAIVAPWSHRQGDQTKGQNYLGIDVLSGKWREKKQEEETRFCVFHRCRFLKSSIRSTIEEDSTDRINRQKTNKQI